MIQSATQYASQVDRWASRQLADDDAHRPGTIFAEGVRMSVQQAYAVQKAVSELRAERGDALIGYKIGCTCEKVRRQLQVDQPVWGRLFASQRHACGALLRLTDYDHLAIEGELAVELRDTLAEGELNDSIIAGCVNRVFPVIELHQAVFRGESPSAAELIANNAFHAGFIASDRCDGLRDVADAAIAIFIDGHLVDGHRGSELVHHITRSLRWLSAALQRQGERLEAGHIVLTGSLPRLIHVHAPCAIRVEAPPFGSVQAEVIG